MVSPAFEGMSLRDWFAGQALPTLVDVLNQMPCDTNWSRAIGKCSEMSYQIADAMLAEREVRS